MNLYILDKNPFGCASAYSDAHTIKYCREYAFILSAIHQITNSEYANNVLSMDYKNRNYTDCPITKWVLESEYNYFWLYLMWKALSCEYKQITGCDNPYFVTNDIYLKRVPEINKNVAQTPFPFLVPLEYKGSDIVESYRKYYLSGRVRGVAWIKKTKPTWADNNV